MTEATPQVRGRAHVQRKGWIDATPGEDGSVVFGTTGEALRLEALSITAEGPISYKAHVQRSG